MLEDVLLLPAENAVRVQVVPAGAARPIQAGDLDDPIAGEIRRRSEEHVVHDREDRGVRADAEGDRQDCRRREPGIPEKQATREPHVLHEAIEPADGPHVTRHVRRR
jgi:hypothetical protein